jgi:isopenicillin N synthase-like dioxygenase
LKDIPIIDTSKFLAQGGDDEQCVALKDAVSHYGLAIILDERVEPGLPVKYREVAQEVFKLPPDVKAKYIQPPLEDGRQLYENGWRPPFTERPRRRDEVLHLIPDQAKPKDPPSEDPKERLMYPFGKPRQGSQFPTIDLAEPIIVNEVEGYRETSEAWGRTMYMVLMTVAQMLAIGFGEPRDLFWSLLEHGPHRLAPTGLDLSKWGPGTVAAGFHNDMSAFTLHGMSNWPGLWAWTRFWEKFAVRLPDERHLLLQVGRALEHLTAGAVMRGYHEVVIGEERQDILRALLLAGQKPWRVTTTSFCHIATDSWLEPIGGFVNLPLAEKYIVQRILSGARQEESIFRKARRA